MISEKKMSTNITYQTAVRPTLPYSGETWPMSKKREANDNNRDGDDATGNVCEPTGTLKN